MNLSSITSKFLSFNIRNNPPVINDTPHEDLQKLKKSLMAYYDGFHNVDQEASNRNRFISEINDIKKNNVNIKKLFEMYSSKLKHLDLSEENLLTAIIVDILADIPDQPIEYFKNLPKEIIDHIASFLPPKDILQWSKTSRYFNTNLSITGSVNKNIIPYYLSEPINFNRLIDFLKSPRCNITQFELITQQIDLTLSHKGTTHFDRLCTALLKNHVKGNDFSRGMGKEISRPYFIKFSISPS